MENLSESHLFTSVEELSEANQKAGWRIECSQLMPGSFSTEFAARDCHEFLVMRECFHRSLEIRGEPPRGKVTAFITGNPDLGGTLNGEQLGKGRFFIIMPGAELDVIILGGVEAYSFFLPELVFSDVVAKANMSSQIGHRGQVLSFQAKPIQLDTLSRTMSMWLSKTKPRDVFASQTLASNVSMNLVALMSKSADAFKDITSCRCNEEVLLLRRARDYVEANIKHPIRIAEMCSCVDVRIRTLQRLFKRELNLSPTRYILARRLAAVRRRLTQSDALSEGVTRIALDHGFVHLGRFAGEYRRYFGETPSETLKRFSVVHAPDANRIVNNSGSEYTYNAFF